MAGRPLLLDLKQRDASRTEFSLVRGGIIYRLEQRWGLLGEKHLGIKRRILLFWGIAWFPILILELVRMASARTVYVPHPLLTSGLGIGLERSRKMRFFPSSPATTLVIVLAGMLPFLPLPFLAISAEEILRAALRLLV